MLSRTLTASWSPCIQTVIWGRQRAHGQPSAIRWSDFHRPRPKRILMASPTGRFVSAAPGPAERTVSLAFVGLFLSRNGAGIPSFLIRKPTCAFVHRKKGQSGLRSGEFGQQLFWRPPRFQGREETEGTASEGFPTQGEALPPRWAERPAIPRRAQPLGLNDATSDIAQTAASNVQGMFNRSENAK